MRRWKLTITAIIFLWGVALIPAFGSGSYSDAWLDGTPQMYEQAQLLSQMLGDNVGAQLAPAAADDSPPKYELGDERDFYATNMTSGNPYTLKASARAISDRGYIFVENGLSVGSTKIDTLLSSFDKIYNSTTQWFGSPPDTIDRDPRIYILILDILDTQQADGSRIIGYFSPINQYRNADISRFTNQRSNEIEMIYIDYIALNHSTDWAESVIAHEFTHMIQWARDPNEDTWINEGLAVYAEAALGYEVEDRISAFEKNADISLLDWTRTVQDYGAAYLFLAYVSEKYGGIPTISAIMSNRSRGARGIERALAATGKSVSFHSLFSDWVVANYLDDPELSDGRYGYSTLDVRLSPSNVEQLYPIDQKMSTVKPWAARYTEFQKGQHETLSLTVSKDEGSDIVARLIEFGDEIDVSEVKSGEAEAGTTTISPSGEKAVLVVTSQPSLKTPQPADSDYNYSAEVQATITSVEPVSNGKITTWGALKRNN